MSINNDMTGSTPEQVLQEALNAMIGDYASRRFAPLTEADVQCHLYAECLKLLADAVPFPLHANWRLSSPSPGLARAKFDLILGNDEMVVEIKFEANYTGVSKPVCFPREIAKDVERLQLARECGVSRGWLILIDEDGTHQRNLHKYISLPLNWRELRRDDGQRALLLVLRI